MSAGTNRGPVLLDWARARLRQELGGDVAMRPAVPWGDEKVGTFVTWRWSDQRLQGCIGNLGADRAILEDVAHNAVAAGLHDPRARQLALGDLDALHAEVSVLSPLEEIGGEADIRIGIDGIVLQQGWKRATFLPIMWTQLPTLGQFMGELKRKAGLPRSFPSAELQLWRYTVDRYE
jgi:AmmeMemoRadiSam system protein A